VKAVGVRRDGGRWRSVPKTFCSASSTCKWVPPSYPPHVPFRCGVDEVPFCVTTDDSTTSRSRLLHNRRYFSGPSQPSCGASERRPTRPGFFSAPHNPPRPPPIPEWPHPRLHRCRRPRGRHRPPRTLAAREAGRRSRRP
jgi:hypothetical protein